MHTAAYLELGKRVKTRTEFSIRKPKINTLKTVHKLDNRNKNSGVLHPGMVNLH